MTPFRQAGPLIGLFLSRNFFTTSSTMVAFVIIWKKLMLAWEI